MNTPHVVETALLLLAAFLLGCAIGYLLRRLLASRGAGAAPEGVPERAASADVTPPADPVAAAASPVALAPVEAAADRVSVAPAAPQAPAEPPLLEGARGGVPDDLKKIKGIGPRMEETLNGLGIYHYDQIAALDETAVAWIELRIKSRGRVGREQWVSQARALAGPPPV